ncbi:hypothetical protein CK501_14240 [Halovibrio salipaludis]|uniref:DUF445 domain-containing protein n=1 Tax=Halovibrio salipaludis TaxID=2032626 RepID=A0A2A2EZR2_9GAMM|nr:hypothetical protein [Halovibrio salipaludis]PAU77847.1 hypothetical protein CK501_14240 [Halovibrio salipaludis]
MTDLFTNPEFWKYLSIPVIAALIGWITNWMAIKLTFYPKEFIGIRPFLGWQGIIPSKAEKMARIAVDSTIAKIGTVQEIFEYIDPRVLTQYIVDHTVPRTDEYVDEIMLAEHPTFWENLPQKAREMVYQRVRDRSPELVDNLVDDFSNNAEDLLDIQNMVVTQLGEDRSLLNRIFLECGEKEFRFIINSGLYFGFAFGIIQMIVWYYFQAGWILPFFGLLVGWATNWIALNFIFRPLYPVKIGPFRLQGQFLRRQPEVAQSFCHIVTHEILTVGNLVDAILNGPKADRARNLVRKHMKKLVDETAGMGKAFTQMAFGPTSFANLKQRVGDLSIEIASETFDDPMFANDRAAAVEDIMRRRMEELSPAEFQELLRPCFQEDEIKLIAAGAALGFLAGLAQLTFIFGATMF